MSIHKSYFDKSNTLIYNSYTNTARNPIVELFYGRVDNVAIPLGYSRYIFNIDTDDLKNKISTGLISTGCTGFSNIKHILRMTNTSFFDKELLNDKTSQGRRRATSFDLILFRIPQNQPWDSGVGYDYYDFGITNLNDRSFSQRPSNWFETLTISAWTTPGVYSNTNSVTGTGVNYSGLTIIDTQHFEFGNEDIEFDMTNEINQYLTGSTSGFTGWGIAYLPQLENLTGLTENYSVGFFTRHTQTFYEPFLETSYNDLILDNRNSFYSYNNNRLYLYSYIGGVPTSLDNLPIVTLENNQGNVVGTYTGCQITQGVYQITTSGITVTTPCMFTDTWSNLVYDGVSLPNVVNDLTVLPYQGYFTLGTQSKDPELFGFDFYGIKQDEKILNTDLRKVGVIIKKAYTSNQVLTPVTAYYRIYVKEGTTEVQVQDWTQINRASNEYYFIFDTRDKIPNEYNVDIKVLTSGEVDTYKKTLTFQIVDKK
jgi:hypothetical protein